MTPEHLQRLAEAREKANEVRTKQSLVKKAEKEELKKKKKQELEEKYNQLVAPKQEEPKEEVKVPEVKEEIVSERQPEQPMETTERVVQATKTRKPRKKVTKVIEVDSEDSSSSSSEDEYDITPIKEKYRQKYKNKYATRYREGLPKGNTLQPSAYSPQQDALTIAKYNIQSKVNQEVQRMAMASLFG